jgi:hypothetical protein
LCEAAGLPVVCSHSMRGLHSTLAAGFGVTDHAAAKALGHTSFAVTRRHDVDREVLKNAFGPPEGPGSDKKKAPVSTAWGVRGGGLGPPWLLTASTSNREQRAFFLTKADSYDVPLNVKKLPTPLHRLDFTWEFWVTAMT